MARQLYSCLFTLLLPFILLRLWWRGHKAPAYRLRWQERLGMVSDYCFSRPPIWIHAVSVGEVVAAVPLVEKLIQFHPNSPVLITTMTPTGSARVKALFGERVAHTYAPYDLTLCVNNFLSRVRPRVLVIMETELWPNWMHSCSQRGIPCILANGRLSEKSAAGYARFKPLVRPMLQQLSWMAVQEDMHAARFIALGARSDSLSVIGNVKLDLQVEPDSVLNAAALRQRWGEQRLVLVAGSTHEGEENLLLKVFANLLRVTPELLLVLVPRHPERFGDVAKMLAQQGWLFSCWSDSEQSLSETQVLLVDTMGELMAFYAAADIALVGGSLIDRGGHNPLEPAALAVPVIMGESVFNFKDICEHLQSVEALTITSPTTLEADITSLLTDRVKRRANGKAGQNYIAANKGTLELLYSGLKNYL